MNYEGKSGGIASWASGPWLVTHQTFVTALGDYHKYILFDPTETSYVEWNSYSESWARRRALLALCDELRVESELTAAQEPMSLAELRKSRGLTQQDLARRMGASQSAVSRIERQDDLFLKTLFRVILAMGGDLRLYAVYGDETIELTRGNDADT